MSKFFTPPLALLLAWVSTGLASETMSPALAPEPLPETTAESVAPGPGLPVALTAGRFSALGRKSPFTLASTTEENADFAKDLILAGYFRMDGKDFVLVANRTQPNRLMVGSQPSAAAQGLTLVKVERDPSGDATKMRAQVRKGTETATLKYEVSGAAAPAAPGQAIPGQPPIPAQPQVAGQPQPAQVVPAVAGQKPNPNPPVIRRRVIPTPPGTR